jgi:hypothetical protein
MRKKWTRLVCLLFMTTVCCQAAARAESPAAGSGDFVFENITEAEALRIIGRDTGIVINAPFDLLQNKVWKTYAGDPIPEIVTDLLRRRNHAIVWHYDDQRLVAIDIRIDDQGGGARPKDRAPAFAPGNRLEPVSGRASDRQRTSPRQVDPERYPGVERPPMPPGL